MDKDRVSGTATEFKGDVKEGVGEFVGDTKLKAEGSGDQLRGATERVYGQARDSVRDAANVVQDQASSIGAYIDETIQERPLTALLTVGAVGYMLGLLMHRR